MGLDWCIQTEEGSDKDPCDIVGAKKVGDVLTREEHIAKLTENGYKDEYIEQMKTDDKLWDETSKKWSCDACPGSTNKICSKCPEGGIGCIAFGMGNCNFRGKITTYALEAAGIENNSITYNDCKVPADWDALIGAITTAIDNVQGSGETVFSNDWTFEELVTHLQQAKFWLNFWYDYVKKGEPIQLLAWY